MSWLDLHRYLKELWENDPTQVFEIKSQGDPSVGTGLRIGIDDDGEVKIDLIKKEEER